MFEIAKDLAAFANALGGTVLVGASEQSDALGRRTGRIEGFVPNLDDQALIKAAAVAARDHCQPPLIVEPEVIKLTAAEQSAIANRPHSQDVTLVALNVHPLIASPCGVAACDSEGTKIPNAYRFPLRFLEGTKWLKPEELAFHMNSHERRMYLLLARHPRDQPLQVWDKGQGNAYGAKRLANLVDLDPERMIVKLEFRGGKIIAHVPLVFVTAVWVDEKDTSNIDVQGHSTPARPPVAPLSFRTEALPEPWARCLRSSELPGDRRLRLMVDAQHPDQRLLKSIELVLREAVDDPEDVVGELRGSHRVALDQVADDSGEVSLRFGRGGVPFAAETRVAAAV